MRVSVEGRMRYLEIGLGLGHDVLKWYVIMFVQCLVDCVRLNGMKCVDLRISCGLESAWGLEGKKNKRRVT
jgi:hypothetical protein